MARTVTAPELARLFSRDRAEHVRVEIQDSEAAWVDYTTLGGHNWVIGATLSEDIDGAVVTGQIMLARSQDGDSLAPLMTLSGLNVDSLGGYAPKLYITRRTRIYVAVVAPGTAPISTDWHLQFNGYTTAVDWSQPDIVLDVVDEGHRLNLTTIQQAEPFGDAAGSPVETEMQAIIDRWVPSPPTLVVVGGSPGWQVKEWRQERVSVMQAIRDLALQIAWEVRYGWGTGDTAELQFFEPDRAKTVPDWTVVAATSVISVTELSVGDADIRTTGEIQYYDSALGGALNTFTYTDGAAFALHGPRFIGLVETGNIDTLAEATAMLTGAVTDLSMPFATHTLEMPNVWAVELGDLIRHQANAIHYDEDQDYAVVAIRREWRGGRSTMHLSTRGKPAGAHKRWLAMGGTTGVQRSGAPVLTIFEITSEGSADGGQPYGMQHVGLRWGRNCHEIRIHAGRSATPNQGMPSMDNRQESAILTRPEGDIPQAEDWEMLWSIRTETNDWRMSTYLARNLETGQENIRQGAESQAVDTGTGPTGAPTGTMTVTPNGTTMEIRGLTAADASAEHLLYRNKINIMRNAAGAGCDFDDLNLNTSGIYDYEVIAYRNGQTSGDPGSPPPQGGGGAGTASAPAWTAGYPAGGVDVSGNPRVSFNWSGDGVYLASVDIEWSYWQSSNFAVWQTLIAAQPVNPGAFGTVDDTSHPNGTDAYFRLRGVPANPADPELYSETRYARYGTSTLP